MYTADAGGDAFNPAASRGFGSAPQALATAGTALDYLNSAAVGLNGSACGGLLIALGEVQAKLTAAHAALLRRFDAANAHDADGYGSSSSWLAAKAGMPKQAARGRGPADAPAWQPPATQRRARRRGRHRLPRLHHRRLDPQAARADARRDRPHPAGGRRGRGIHRRPGHHLRVRDRDLARPAARPGRPRPG